MERILVSGAVGQIGSELVPALRAKYGADNVIACGHRTEPGNELRNGGPFRKLNCTDYDAVASLVRECKVDAFYHLAGVLSARAEDHPHTAWDVNVNGLINVLDVAREEGCAVLFPSSIGAFGPTTPLDNTPQDTIQRPNKIYGITKVTGELMCDYYHDRWGVDVRGLRYPGIISNVTPPGGGTTDYAVEIFYAAIKEGHYTSPIARGTYLDMMYMPDALNASIQMMEADPARLKHRNAFNITAMSFEPDQLAAEIRKHLPNFTMTYDVDPVKQSIAETWPNKMDDSAAREEWGWHPRFDLSAMVADMLKVLQAKHERGEL